MQFRQFSSFKTRYRSIGVSVQDLWITNSPSPFSKCPNTFFGAKDKISERPKTSFFFHNNIPKRKVSIFSYYNLDGEWSHIGTPCFYKRSIQCCSCTLIILSKVCWDYFVTIKLILGNFQHCKVKNIKLVSSVPVELLTAQLQNIIWTSI